MSEHDLPTLTVPKVRGDWERQRKAALQGPRRLLLRWREGVPPAVSAEIPLQKVASTWPARLSG